MAGVMGSLRSRSARGGRRLRRAAPVSLLVPLLVPAVVYWLAMPHALMSPVIAGGVAGLLALTILVVAVGADRASTVMLVLAFGFAPLTGFSLGLTPLVFASVLFALAFALALPHLVHRPLRLPSMFLVGSVLFTAMGLLAIPLAVSPAESGIYLLTAVVALIAMPAAIVWMAPSDRLMFVLTLAFGIGTAASTLYGLPGYVYRNAGFTYHPVALGYTAMLTLSFVPFMLASKVRGRWLMVTPVALIALVGVWTAGSRTGIVVIAILALLVPVFERSIRLGLVLAAGVVLVLPFVFTYDPSGNETSALSRLFGAGGARGSDDTRLNTLRDGFEQVQSSPILGNGYSTESTYVIHNLYVQVLAAEGLIGLLGILLLFGALLVPLRTATAPQRCLAYPVLAVLLAAPFQPNMADHYLAMTLGLALVAAVGVMPQRASDTPSSTEPSTAMARRV